MRTLRTWWESRPGNASLDRSAPVRADDPLLRAGRFPYLVAEDDGAISGYAYAGPYRGRPAYRWTVENSIYIAPHAQRRGIGRVLLERLILEATTGGFRQMIAVIGDSANVASIELHRTMGFRMVGTFDHVGFKFGRWLDSVLMQRPLGNGATTSPDGSDRQPEIGNR